MCELFLTIGRLQPPQDSLATFKEGLKFLRENSDLFLEAKCYESLGQAFLAIGSMGASLEMLKKAIQNYEKMNLHWEQARTLLWLGVAFHALSMLSESLQCLQKSLELLALAGDPILEINLVAQIASVQHKIGNHTLAIQNFEKILPFAEYRQSPSSYLFIYFFLKC
jgi:tetratricopeptide (TPR) repeat protein